MRSTLGILSAAFLFVGAPSHAEPFSGNDVFHACMDEANGVKQGFCYGYILGAAEGMKWGGLLGVAASQPQASELGVYDLLSGIAVGFCIPPALENRQVIDIVLAYMNEHPTTLHESARTQIGRALSQSFPCQ